MRLDRCLSTFVCLLALLSSTAGAAPSRIGFDQTDWRLHHAATVDQGVLRIEGGEGYRTARFDLSADAVGNQPFFFTVDVRLHDIKPGEKVYQRPKVKVFHEGPGKPSVQNLGPQEATD